MKKTVIELFAGVGGFRVGLNDVHEFDEETGIAIENRDWDFIWFNQWEPSTKSQDAFQCYSLRFNETNKNHLELFIYFLIFFFHPINPFSFL